MIVILSGSIMFLLKVIINMWQNTFVKYICVAKINNLSCDPSLIDTYSECKTAFKLSEVVHCNIYAAKNQYIIR